MKTTKLCHFHFVLRLHIAPMIWFKAMKKVNSYTGRTGIHQPFFGPCIPMRGYCA